MTNLEGNPEVLTCESREVLAEVIKPRPVKLTTRTGIKVDRLLPSSTIRMIGPCCFLDHFLPQDNDEIMSVAAHPHAGLQTITWLFSGEVHHHDSLGSDQRIQSGELNLMTAGKGILHSEVSSLEKTPLHGVQLWEALSDEFRNINPSFDHYGDLPMVSCEEFDARVFAGKMFGVESTFKIYSLLVAVEIYFNPDDNVEIQLNENFEYGFMTVDEMIQIESQQVPVGEIYYQQAGRKNLKIKSKRGARVLLIGGEPFGEEILMWWNFIGRSHEEIEKMRELWELRSDIFGLMQDERYEKIPAPLMLSIKLKPHSNKKLG